MLSTKLDQYETIVIDPPWPGPGEVPAFDDFDQKRQVLLPYATMSGIQIASLHVAELGGPASQLFVWSTSRSLGDAFLLMQGWGYRYRGLIVWDKQRLGLGQHVRHGYEFLVWGARRGAPKQRAVPQRQTWKPRGHSEKPAEAYELIAQLSDEPRLDIFARQTRPGFEAWGNEVTIRRGVTT